MHSGFWRCNCRRVLLASGDPYLNCRGRGAIPNRRHAYHRFKVGQTVVAPSEGRDQHIPRGPLVVVRLLPLADGNLNTGSGASLTGWIVWSGKVRSGWPSRKVGTTGSASPRASNQATSVGLVDGQLL